MHLKTLFTGLYLGLLTLILPASAQNKPLTLVSFDYPPFMNVQEGKPATGLMIEVINEAFKRIGKPYKMEFYPLARDFQMLDAGEADALFTVKKTPERETNYLFPKESVLSQDYVFFVLKDSPVEFKGDLKSLANASIGVVNKVSYGSVFDAAAQRGDFKKLEVAPTYEANFKKLLAKRMDVVVCSRIPGFAFLKELNATQQVKVIGPPIETTQSYIMFSKKAGPALVAEFDKAMAAMRSDGTRAKLDKKYSE
ncbi:substrate-binding periplasmic protein [Uliginosibacterium gangwonense]|uniref:substrate-binding periplasmic protein n=1 Tax=Uliginosibacterium gangwonense TaxID=392736 RepID=UPI000376A174|nr:transporter substrate-binding domain-containing protein [Uliginosibacterium gangwonense]